MDRKQSTALEAANILIADLRFDLEATQAALSAARERIREMEALFPTNRQLHENAAGMGLEDAFFRMNGINPDARPAAIPLGRVLGDPQEEPETIEICGVTIQNGCASHSCYVRRPTGMATNGPCRCLPGFLGLTAKVKVIAALRAAKEAE